MTLIETILVMTLITVAFYLVKVGIQFLNNIYQTGARMAVVQEANLTLDLITQDIRNSLSINADDPYTGKIMILQTFNFHLGFNTAAFFDPANGGTITYEAKTDGSKWYLERRVVFPAFPEQNETRKFMLGRIKPPNNTTDFVFQPYPANAVAPFQAMSVALRVPKGSWTSAEKVFDAMVAKRAQAK